ncbi:hypothetical protein Aspvir_003721 [Aspergillus viridinutans]|uniref:Urease accessory protein UreF n=1 Tax=Aspergillus viridinutans TaxID=75553 RepID=A0A9P3BND9_ASPVI|nr:uncharacterized protein Aspvir_003721 [Aspergillus viridinutans]GIJ99719.1 hypothetical protein Aspvir_003721 [Aspergillus viridinutans]
MCQATSASAIDQPSEDKTPDTDSRLNGLELPSHIKFSRGIYADTDQVPLPQTDTIDPSNLVPGHALLLLSDSALPLGSFAYSSGLESYLAHAKLRASSTNSLAAFLSFLSLSIASTASTSLPYLLAAYRHPEALETIDNDMDAATTCIVAQRASVSQGRALLSIWARAFRQAYAPDGGSSAAETAKQALENLFEALKGSDGNTDELGAKGHFAPLWGAVSLAMGLAVEQATYVFMVNHAKAVLSAAVRASVMGPYRAQSILASQSLQDMILERIEREWGTSMEQAGQVVPMLDLWLGRHELLYSRIFNS